MAHLSCALRGPQPRQMALFNMNEGAANVTVAVAGEVAGACVVDLWLGAPGAPLDTCGC